MPSGLEIHSKNVKPLSPRTAGGSPEPPASLVGMLLVPHFFSLLHQPYSKAMHPGKP